MESSSRARALNSASFYSLGTFSEPKSQAPNSLSLNFHTPIIRSCGNEKKRLREVETGPKPSASNWHHGQSPQDLQVGPAL